MSERRAHLLLSISVSRVKALVHLNADVDTVLLGRLDEVGVVCEGLSSRLRDEDVVAALDGVEGDTVEPNRSVVANGS